MIKIVLPDTAKEDGLARTGMQDNKDQKKNSLINVHNYLYAQEQH